MAVRDSLVAFIAATAQAQGETTKEVQRAGIEHAKGDGEYLGRKPSYTREQLDTVRDMLGQSVSTSHIAKFSGRMRRHVSNFI
jgi:DNA invertase Pin-like site-specific DNA recombinase